MKISILAASLSNVLGGWEDWNDYSYCDIRQRPIDDMYSDNFLYSKDDCAQFCKDKLIEQGDNYDWGWQFCCDYEDWADGTFNCHLIEGFRSTP